MNFTMSVFSVIIAFMLMSGIIPGFAWATELIVEKNPTDPTHYSSIQAAIDYAYGIISTTTDSTISYSVRVEAGTYTEAITLKSGIPIRGRETAATILRGNGSAAVITAANATNTSVANFTITDSTVGINVSNNASLTITNNVFDLGTNGTAILVQDPVSANITNNVFFQNSLAISSNSDATIVNNIFYGNSTAVQNTSPLGTFTKLSYNAFFSNTSIGQTGTNPTTSDPLFVDSASGDFHLKTDSPCINAGSPDVQYNNPTFYPNHPNDRNDMGAYGGPSTDTIPFRVSGVIPSTSANGQISLTWTQNKSYLVSGYRVYYGNASGQYSLTGATEGNSPFNVTTNSATVSGLSTTVPKPARPTLNQPQPRDGSLLLSWSAVPEASSYKVYYGTTSPPVQWINVGEATTYTLTGLTNGTWYYIAVSAVDRAKYYFAITAFDNDGTVPANATRGVAHESNYSDETFAELGSPVESDLSDIIPEYPERLTAYPNLPEGNQGCFIATAAYGDYSAPEVQILRTFRDRFLLTNRAGSAFVGWYYRYSPAVANTLNHHPWLKPVVRMALMPFVGSAYMMNASPLLFSLGLLVFFGCAVLLLVNRRRLFRFGGIR